MVGQSQHGPGTAILEDGGPCGGLGRSSGAGAELIADDDGTVGVGRDVVQRQQILLDSGSEDEGLKHEAGLVLALGSTVEKGGIGSGRQGVELLVKTVGIVAGMADYGANGAVGQGEKDEGAAALAQEGAGRALPVGVESQANVATVLCLVEEATPESHPEFVALTAQDGVISLFNASGTVAKAVVADGRADAGNGIDTLRRFFWSDSLGKNSAARIEDAAAANAQLFLYSARVILTRGQGRAANDAPKGEGKGDKKETQQEAGVKTLKSRLSSMVHGNY